MAQHHLGVLFETGEGVGKDHARASAWYLRAAEQVSEVDRLAQDRKRAMR